MSAPLVQHPADTACPLALPEIIPGRLESGILLLCDHASNALPPELSLLGMVPAQLERHIAYDIGAAAVTRAMAEILQAPAILTRFSRLLIDPNRGRQDPTLVMRLSDGALVPGNARLTDAEIAERVTRYYAPYDSAISSAIDAATSAGSPPAIISMHSFTSSWKGMSRPWHAGILWDQDARLAMPLIDALRDERDLIVGDNEPYVGGLPGDTIDRHATSRGLKNVLIEVRQDLIANAEAGRAWGARLAGAICRAMGKSIRPVLAD